jgi:ABC-type lipoprotein release transport system permease subunit
LTFAWQPSRLAHLWLADWRPNYLERLRILNILARIILSAAFGIGVGLIMAFPSKQSPVGGLREAGLV